jgi:hypothetical protein
VDREDPAVREDVLDSVDRVERDLDLAHGRDSARGPAALPAQAVCCPDRVKVPRRGVLQDVRLHVVVAASVTRRLKKAR